MNEPPVRPEPDPADLEHLQLLGIFHYLVGGLMLLFSCFFIIHLVFGLVMPFNPDSFHGSKGEPSPPPVWLACLFVLIASGALVTGWTVGGLIIYSGRCLRKHQRRMFSQIIAGIVCMFTPFGTALGVFTILVLQRPSVRRLYGE